MTPKVVKSADELERAKAHLESLKRAHGGNDRDSQIELWTMLVEHYEGPKAPAKRRPATLYPFRSQVLVPKTRDAGKYLFDVRPAQAAPMTGARTWVFFIGCAALIYLRLLYHSSFFPSFFEGEEAKSLDLAKSTYDFAQYTHSWWRSIKGGAIEYNKGYSWALLLFYLHFGYDVRLITYILPVFYGIF